MLETSFLQDTDFFPHTDVLKQLSLKIEALLFAADTPLKASDLRGVLGEEVSLKDIRLSLKKLDNDYKDRAFCLYELDNSYQLRTRESYKDLIQKQFSGKSRVLSRPALETLAIIAYRQPITRCEINAIRQVDSASLLATLKERDLITVRGTRKEVGNPMEYGTTARFLEVFGLASLDKLPNLRSLQMSAETQGRLESALSSLDSY